MPLVIHGKGMDKPEKLFDQGKTNRISLPLTFIPLQGMVMTYSFAKYQGQRPVAVSSKASVDMHGQT